MVGEGAYPGAVARFARACDVAAMARAGWEAEGCPLTLTQPNRSVGVHPVLAVMLAWERAASDRGGELGLSPASAKRVGPSRGRGRPLGSNSAPDRVALPGIQMNPGVPPRLTLAGPGPLMKDAAAAAMNRARGHTVED
jgi:hypothetical protein